MIGRSWLLDRFEAHRRHLRAVASRMLGSTAEADRALHEAVLRLDEASAGNDDDLRAWMTTVVGHVSLEIITSRDRRGDAPEPLRLSVATPPDGDATDPFELERLLGEAVSLALLVALDALTPAERVAFALHEVFGLPTAEVGTIMGRSPAAARRLTARARRRIRGAAPGRHTSA
jgi:RNA polymerase sigma-70 factor, ECF subfamily